MKNLTVIEHPVVKDKMTKLRYTETGTKEFRELVTEISTLICYEALRDTPLTTVETPTPVAMAEGFLLAKKFAIVPIYRAGLGMETGILHVLPNAKVGHVGLYRDPDTLEPHSYYQKFPADLIEREVLLIDPMLATGGTASAACNFLKVAGAKVIKFLCLVTADKGIEKLYNDHPDVHIYTAVNDHILNEHGYIVPGLGDAGDRIFGTK